MNDGISSLPLRVAGRSLGWTMDASWRVAVGRIYVRLNYLTPTCSRVGEKKKCPISNYLHTCSRVGVGSDRLEAPVPAEPSTSAPLQLQQSPAHGSNDRFVSCTGSTFGLHQTVVIRQVCWYVPCTFYICSAGSLTSSRAALVRIASLGAWTLPERSFVSNPRRYQGDWKYIEWVPFRPRTEEVGNRTAW